ncbi:major facilitator superfamily domain-containing protein [Microdochium trichocladiopsis]|uniref:Major facilitator superfamily domain-containing protein n=1 Tax=Microdochium trichocladiopsis TaxID=1682393 RepID=A0A9P9BNA9_9PEZI|nr:major facilitator superfamily domain-containing protein [Microdochium trichocladiopsis]KAH7020698.1 major facilitator superfamily domain-containing protein [Microdochium trichocladiopsis]
MCEGKSVNPVGDARPQHSSNNGDYGERSYDVLSPEIKRSYVRKMDLWLLPFLTIMYFFNAIDRTNLGNAQTDRMGTALGFMGEQYSILILFFYIPNGLFDLPLNLLTKRFLARVMLPTLMTGWGAMSLIQAGCKSFAPLLVVRLILAALLAGAFSGLLSFGVFQISHPYVQGWRWLFIIEGALTVIFGVVAFWWLPASPQTTWFLKPEEREVARLRSLRDGSNAVGEEFNFKESFRSWKDWKFTLWCIISFTYPVAFATTANVLPLILQRFGYSTVITNLLTLPPNVCGFLVLLAVTYSSDRQRERTFHIVGSLALSLTGFIILACLSDQAPHRVAVGYFACFLLTSGAYIPSCLVHSWHNNNNLSENSRAATTGLLVGLGNLGGVLSATTFRTAYAPRYIPTLAATAGCNVVCIFFTLWMGLWPRRDNRRRDKEQGVVLKAEQVNTQHLADGANDPSWRWFL